VYNLIDIHLVSYFIGPFKEGRLKLNVDGSFLEYSRYLGVSVVVRNNDID